MSPLSSKVPAPNADGVGADAAGSSARDHRIGFVGTEGSIARSSGAGQLSPIQIPAIARSRAGAAPPSAAAMSSTFVDGDGAGMSLFASLELLSSLVAPTRFPGERGWMPPFPILGRGRVTCDDDAKRAGVGVAAKTAVDIGTWQRHGIGTHAHALAGSETWIKADARRRPSTRRTPRRRSRGVDDDARDDGDDANDGRDRVGRGRGGRARAPRVARPTSTSTSGSCRDRVDVRSRTRRAASSSTDDARDRDANPVGFQSIADDDRDGGVVPKAVQDDYRKVEDPEWLERMLLREETEYPTSRGAVLRQALVNGDVKGVSYAMSSVK
eukprot:11823-Pelagococcus_subviridis.AAC.1